MSATANDLPPALTAQEAVDRVQQRRVDMLGRVEAASQAQQQLTRLRVSEHSLRADIAAVVSARGTLLELRLGASTSVMTPHDLAAEIVATVQRACVSAGAQTLQLLAQALPTGADLADVVVDPALPKSPDLVEERGQDAAEPASWLRPVYGDGSR